MYIVYVTRFHRQDDMRIASVLLLVVLDGFKTFLGFECVMGVTKSQMVHQNIGQGSLRDLSSWKYSNSTTNNIIYLWKNETLVGETAIDTWLYSKS